MLISSSSDSSCSKCPLPGSMGSCPQKSTIDKGASKIKTPLYWFRTGDGFKLQLGLTKTCWGARLGRWKLACRLQRDDTLFQKVLKQTWNYFVSQSTFKGTPLPDFLKRAHTSWWWPCSPGTATRKWAKNTKAKDNIFFPILKIHGQRVLKITSFFQY